MAYMLSNYMEEAGISNLPLWMHGVPMEFPFGSEKPFHHQVDSLRDMVQFERFGEYSDAGTGKTLPMQAYATLYASLGNKVVMVMPNTTLIGQFFETFHEFMVGIENHLSIQKFTAAPAKREKQIVEWDANGWPDILIMTYAMFSKYAPHKQKVKKREKHPKTGRMAMRAYRNPLYGFLKKRDYKVLVADEAHALKNPTSGAHKAFWHYVGNSEGDFALVLATGSPVGNTPMDSFGLIKLVTPDKYCTKKSFQNDFVVFDPHAEYQTVLEYRNFDLLNETLYLQARRVTKQEVFPDLEEPLVSQIPVKLAPKHRALYKKLLKERVLLLKDKLVDAIQETALRMAALQLISCPEYFSDDPVENELRNSIAHLVESIDPARNKIIIFSYFKETVAALAEHFEHLNPAVINGASSNNNAQRIKFLTDDSCRVIVVNWLSGGVGLNLQISSHIVFAEAPTVPKDAQQAIARAHRNGQAEVVNVYFFRVLGTLAAKRIKTLLSKEVENNQVVRDRHKLLAELMDE